MAMVRRRVGAGGGLNRRNSAPDAMELAAAAARASASPAPSAPPARSASPGGELNSFAGGGERYEMKELLGEGNYGSVYRCCRARDGADFAVKVVDPRRIALAQGSSDRTRAVEAMVVQEVQALRELTSHHGIIRLEAAFASETTRQIFILTAYVPGRNLFAHICERTEPLHEREAAHITAQLASALAFCHARGIAHRDVKLENILVADVDVQLTEERGPDGQVSGWRTEQLFSVKICDFGLAKTVKGNDTRTPVGTPAYAAPEVALPAAHAGAAETDKTHEHYRSQCCPDAHQMCTGDEHARDKDPCRYDAFKADAFSLGVAVFVMLCLAFPAKGGGEGAHRAHRRWPSLSAGVRSLLDGLLAHEPGRRSCIPAVCKHEWVVPAMVHRRPEELPAALEPAPPPQVQHRLLPRLLALHTAVKVVQQERGMASWAITGAAGRGGVSCWDQLRLHMEESDQRIADARELLGQASAEQGEALDKVVVGLAAAREATDALRRPRRQLAGAVLSGRVRLDDQGRLLAFDWAFSTYNTVCAALAEIAATALEGIRVGSPEVRRAARRFRLFAAAAEQLGRERAFMCSHLGRADLAAGARGAWGGSPGSEPAPARLRRLAEILGARKVLLGSGLCPSSGDVVATSTGLLSSLIGEGEPPLLGPEDIAELESVEERALAPSRHRAPPMDEWYTLLTRLVNEIHSRIAMCLIDDVGPLERAAGLRGRADRSPTGSTRSCEDQEPQDSCPAGTHGSLATAWTAAATGPQRYSEDLDGKITPATAATAATTAPPSPAKGPPPCPGEPGDRGLASKPGPAPGCRAGLKRLLRAAADRL